MMQDTKAFLGRDIEREAAPEAIPVKKVQSQHGSVMPGAIQALDWDGPNDPENPMNWPAGKKILHTAISAPYTFALTTGISTPVAGIPSIMLQFDKSRNLALFPVSLYTAGFVFGPTIAAPISELHGRRIIYQVTFVLLVVFNIIAVTSDNFVTLVIFRFLAGLGGSGVMAVGAGMLSDLWDPREVGRVGVAYVVAPFLGPSMGPLIGAYAVAQYDDWKWTVWAVLCILAPVGIGILFTSETSKQRILYLRAKKPGDKVVGEGLAAELKKVAKAMMKPWHMCVFEPVSLFLGLYTGYSFAMMFSFFGSYAYVYSMVYGFDTRQIGLCYIAVIVGIIFGLVTFVIFDLTKYQKEVIRTGDKVVLEHRLYAALLGSWLVPVGLFWYAWMPCESVYWIIPVLAGIPFGWGTIASFLACLAYIAVTYGPADIASAVAANGIVRMTLGAVFPMFIIQVYEGLGVHWAGTLFAFISLVFIPVPWLLFWKGKELRKRSYYETSPY
ncbi:major facilitator superfamily domain-containing protein [Dactylonectria macrodidyma]|uniref:Major facilitator superfamily domain-containing protein n=1 Tax=Dactylonectria macrodidyma TaxID=307937 RepID=A0A9P9DTC8_9HYPO|nr:major facilitator superfamily domain-containing protein [Dactylonectria macrodidyma]